MAGHKTPRDKKPSDRDKAKQRAESGSRRKAREGDGRSLDRREKQKSKGKAKEVHPSSSEGSSGRSERYTKRGDHDKADRLLRYKRRVGR